MSEAKSRSRRRDGGSSHPRNDNSRSLLCLADLPGDTIDSEQIGGKFKFGAAPAISAATARDWEQRRILKLSKLPLDLSVSSRVLAYLAEKLKVKYSLKKQVQVS